MLSIITVTYNDLAALKKTVSSLRTSTFIGPWEHIIIDGGSDDGTREYFSLQDFTNLRFYSQPDHGIYDAMNKGIDTALGNQMLFLNAGDTFSGSLNTQNLQDYDLIDVTIGSNLKPYPVWNLLSPFAMPYCHQGMIFPVDNLRFNIKYRLVSDLDYVYRSGRSNFQTKNRITSCSVNFDDNGVSSQRFCLRDFESFLVIYNHSKVKGIIFAVIRLLLTPIKILRSWNL